MKKESNNFIVIRIKDGNLMQPQPTSEKVASNMLAELKKQNPKEMYAIIDVEAEANGY